jgi:hypothetical protein
MTRLARPGPRAFVLVVPLLLAALAACGQATEDPGIASAGGATPTTGASNAASKADPQKWADCMRKYGIEVEIKSNGKGGTSTRVGGPGSKPMDKNKMDKAQADCKQYEPGGGEGNRKPMSKEDQQKFLKFAQCMRDHGIPMEDPKFEGGGAQLGITTKKGQEPAQGKVEAAQKACESNLPDPDGDGEPGAHEGGGA